MLEHGDLNGARWDYLICYDGMALAVEVHPAQTKNVEEMLKKAEWLKGFLKEHKDIKTIISPRLFWISSGKTDIRGNIKLKLAEARIEITGGKLRLPISHRTKR